jgi:hypothetical protein
MHESNTGIPASVMDTTGPGRICTDSQIAKSCYARQRLVNLFWDVARLAEGGSMWTRIVLHQILTRLVC